MEQLGVKDPEETVLLTFDFSKALSPSETIQSAETTMLVKTGTDPSPNLMVSGPASIDNEEGKVLQLITGGIAGVTYAARCKASTSAGKVLVLAATLPVKNAHEI